MVVWKRSGVSRCGLGPLLGRGGLPAVAMDEGHIEQHGRQAGGVGRLLGEEERFVAPPQRLVRITKRPQDHRRVGQAPRPGVDPFKGEVF